MKIYTTSLEVSKRIKEIIGEQESYFYRHSGKVLAYYEIRGRTVSEENPIVPCFALSELPEVLKKCGEKLEWENETLYPQWLDIFEGACNELAIGQSVDDFLLEILK